jgi:hypothetical protein
MKIDEIKKMIENLPEEPLWLIKCSEAIIKGLSSSNHNLKPIMLNNTEKRLIPTHSISSYYKNIIYEDLDVNNLYFK